MSCKPHATRPQGTCFPEKSIRTEVSSVQKMPERCQIGSEAPGSPKPEAMKRERWIDGLTDGGDTQRVGVLLGHAEPESVHHQEHARLR